MSSQVFLNVLIRKYPHGCSSGALCTSALGVHGEWLPEQTMQLRMSPAEPAPRQALRPISCCVHQTSKFSAQPLLKIMAQTPQKISSGKRTEQPAPFLLPSWHQAGFPRAASIPPPVLLCILRPLCGPCWGKWSQSLSPQADGLLENPVQKNSSR